MPKTDESGHTEAYWIRVKVVSSFLLSNQEFLESKRSVDLQEVVKDQFECQESVARKYIAEAKKDIKQLYSKNVDKQIGKALRDREEHIRALKLQLEEAGKPPEKARYYQLLQSAYKDRDELIGLYEQKVKHTGTINLKNINLSSFTDDQLAKLKAYLHEGVELKEALLHLGVIIK